MGARAPDTGEVLPVYRVSLVEITPPMQLWQSTRYQLKLCDRPQNRQGIGSQPWFDFCQHTPSPSQAGEMRSTDNFPSIFNRVAT